METAQKIDPLGGITARIFVIVVGAICIATAIFLVSVNRAEFSSRPLQIAAGLTLFFTYVYFVWAAEPFRRSITRSRYLLVFALVLLACILNSLSELGSNVLIRNDWGPICVAFTLMLAASYRPPVEILVYTAVAVAVVTLLTCLHFSTLQGDSHLASIVVATAPALALGVGAAVYSGYLVAGLRRDRERAAEEKARRDAIDRREAIEEFLGRDVEALRREVLPFLRSVKAQDALTEADTAHSAALALSLRSLLEQNLQPEPFADTVGVFADPESLAAGLTATQRAAVRALLVFLASQPGVVHADLTLLFSAEPAARGLIRSPAAADRAFALQAQPFIGLIQLAFSDVESVQSSDHIEVSFAL